MNTFLFILGWVFLITSWLLPESCFTDKRQVYGIKALFSLVATLIFTAGFLNFWFKWW